MSQILRRWHKGKFCKIADKVIKNEETNVEKNVLSMQLEAAKAGFPTALQSSTRESLRIRQDFIIGMKRTRNQYCGVKYAEEELRTQERGRGY